MNVPGERFRRPGCVPRRSPQPRWPDNNNIRRCVANPAGRGPTTTRLADELPAAVAVVLRDALERTPYSPGLALRGALRRLVEQSRKTVNKTQG